MTAASTAWGVGDVSINGVVINEGVTAGSLATKVDAINAVSSQTGVTAEAFVTAELDLSSVSTFSSAALDINGTLTTALSSGATIADLATAINNQSDLTGIKATMSGQNILLEGNSSAMNIAIASAASAAVINTTIESSASITITKGDNISAGTALVGMSGGSTSYKTVYGGLKLTSDTGNPISIDLGTAASIAEHGLLEANNVGAAAGGAALSSLSVDSATNAQKAIDVIDNALNTVNGQRGDLGAVNNRLEFTVDNLQSVSQQTSAARSRILDADFAKESASLSRAQVLQQAGTAMLAQANSAPQQVLSILR
jgi:flagellin